VCLRPRYSGADKPAYEYGPDALEAQQVVASGSRVESTSRRFSFFASVLHRAVKETKMEVLYPCCCGLDVHKKSITACVLWAYDYPAISPSSGEQRRKHSCAPNLCARRNTVKNLREGYRIPAGRM